MFKDFKYTKGINLKPVLYYTLVCLDFKPLDSVGELLHWKTTENLAGVNTAKLVLFAN